MFFAEIYDTVLVLSKNSLSDFPGVVQQFPNTVF